MTSELPDPHPPTRPVPEPPIQRRPSTVWLWFIAGIWIITLLIAAAIGLATRSPRAFVFSVGYYVIPIAGFVSLMIAITNIGRLARRFCGWCGYDRTGMKVTELCPECGKDATSRDAPGHKSVGARTLPPWIAGLLIVTLFGVMTLYRILPSSAEDFIPLALIASLAIILAIGCWHAWHQVK